MMISAGIFLLLKDLTGKLVTFHGVCGVEETRVTVFLGANAERDMKRIKMQILMEISCGFIVLV
jgi:hypothetical protein